MTRESSNEFDVHVLGPMSVAGADGQLDPGGRKPRLVLALLLADIGAAVSTERLIDGLHPVWHPRTPRRAEQRGDLRGGRLTQC